MSYFVIVTLLHFDKIGEGKNDERLRGEYMTLITRITEAEARGEARGEDRGIAKAKAEIVMEMYKNDVDIFTICKYSKLSDKEVLDIIRSHQKAFNETIDPDMIDEMAADSVEDGEKIKP